MVSIENGSLIIIENNQYNKLQIIMKVINQKILNNINIILMK